MQVIGFLLNTIRRGFRMKLGTKHDARAYPAAIIAAREAIGLDHNEIRVEAFEEINVEPKELMTRVETN